MVDSLQEKNVVETLWIIGKFLSYSNISGIKNPIETWYIPELFLLDKLPQDA